MSFTCPRCGMTSHNPNDEAHGYCGNCHDFTGERDMTVPMPETARRLLDALVEIEDQAIEAARIGGCTCNAPHGDRTLPIAIFDRDKSVGVPFNEVRWQVEHEDGCIMAGQRGQGFASEPKCEQLSPETQRPCYLNPGHRGAHEAWRGPYAMSSWA
jgi:hypothetical protein